MIIDRTESAYVIDTQALHWSWTTPARLTANATVAFRSMREGRAIGLIPAIVVAELSHMSARRGARLSIATILARIDGAPAWRVDPITRQHLQAFDRATDVREIHDRLLVAAALVHDATIITSDVIIRASQIVRTVW